MSEIVMDRKVKQPAEGEDKPAATRLNELPAAIRAQVIEILDGNTYKAAEPLVSGLVGFQCSSDVLYRFRKWMKASKRMEMGRERLSQIASFLKEQMPEASTEEMREMSGIYYTLISLGDGDARTFVDVSRAESQAERERIRQKRLDLDERMFKESLRGKLDAGLDGLAKLSQGNPEAMKHFNKAAELIGAGTKFKIQILKGEVDARS